MKLPFELETSFHVGLRITIIVIIILASNNKHNVLNSNYSIQHINTINTHVLLMLPSFKPTNISHLFMLSLLPNHF